jgi:hypothetical protein
VSYICDLLKKAPVGTPARLRIRRNGAGVRGKGGSAESFGISEKEERGIWNYRHTQELSGEYPVQIMASDTFRPQPKLFSDDF